MTKKITPALPRGSGVHVTGFGIGLAARLVAGCGSATLEPTSLTVRLEGVPIDSTTVVWRGVPVRAAHFRRRLTGPLPRLPSGMWRTEFPNGDWEDNGGSS